jgi:hypothetical protein
LATGDQGSGGFDVTRAALALCAAVGAGCFSDRGIAIEVDVGDTGATSVELYLGSTHCGSDAMLDCRAIAPPDGTIALRGTVWFRDGLVPYTAAVKDGRATFRVQVDEPTTLPIAVAVGLLSGAADAPAVGSATLRDVLIPVDTALRVTTTLAAAAPVQPGQLDTRMLTEQRVLVWSKRTPASSCVVVEHWQDGDVTRDFVVPAEDPDCDDVPTECNPTAYHGTSAAGTALRPDCFASDVAGACVLASRGCSDDDGVVDATCAPQREPVCVPAGFCTTCPDLDGTCTRDLVDDPLAMIPHVECTVPARRAGVALEPCAGGTPTPIALGAHTGGATCEQPVLSALQLGGFGTTRDFGGALIELSSPTPPCSFQLKWKGGLRTAPEPADHGVIKLPFADRALLLPIVLRFTVGTCTPADQLRCVVAGDAADSVWSCAQ